ncbi:MAG: hypothetical protein ACK4RK_14820 [Gemmataceae bacterium]
MYRPLLIVLVILVPHGEWSAGQEPIQPAVPVNEAALAKIQSLQPNQAAVLGQADVIGDFNEVAKRFNLDKTGPRGRDFTIKMVWAPERRRVLFCGANHGVPHRLNDVWEFDLAALTWIMLYAPDNARDYTGLGKDYSDVEFKDGILITKRGGPAVIAHTWWGLTYDPVQKQMLFMNTWVTNKQKAVELLGGDPAQLYTGPPLWAFSPHTATWKMLKTAPPYPRPIFGGMLEYVPDLNGSIWHGNNWQMRGTWLYDAKRNQWRDLKANSKTSDFEQQSPAPEQVGYYDSQRHLVIVQRHKDTFHYDPKANMWKKVLSMDMESEQVPYGHDARSPMYHDPVSGHGLLVEFKTNTLWAYDPDKITWTKLRPEGDAMPQGNKRLAYFDPAQNVFVVIQDRTVWAYRYTGKP